MCDCCDPTADSPDPVVVRLEAEVERLNFDLCQCRLELETAREISHRLGTERDTLRGLLREAGRLLWEHHECKVSALPPGTVCDICEKSRIFYRIEAALEGKPCGS